MLTIPLTINQKEILDEALRRESQKKKKRFLKRKNNHFNNFKLKIIFENLNVDFSTVLYEIPFKCYFSIYLYLILKSKVQFWDYPEMPEYYRIASSQDLNIFRLSKETGVCRNTIRKAFDELVRYRMLEITNNIIPNHKSTKSLLLYNDRHIYIFDEEYEHVIYSIETPFNFYNN